jgi:hypothetical protein
MAGLSAQFAVVQDRFAVSVSNAKRDGQPNRRPASMQRENLSPAQNGRHAGFLCRPIAAPKNRGNYCPEIQT